MSTHTVVPVSSIPRIGHQEAMAITAEENDRFHRLLTHIEPDQWHLPTDCTRWDVRDITVHVIATAQAAASPLEFGRQMWAGRQLTAEIGGVHWVDGLNEAQLRGPHPPHPRGTARPVGHRRRPGPTSPAANAPAGPGAAAAAPGTGELETAELPVRHGLHPRHLDAPQ